MGNTNWTARTTSTGETWTKQTKCVIGSNELETESGITLTTESGETLETE